MENLNNKYYGSWRAKEASDNSKFVFINSPTAPCDAWCSDQKNIERCCSFCCYRHDKMNKNDLIIWLKYYEEEIDDIRFSSSIVKKLIED